MELIVDRDGARWGGRRMRCAIGRAGIAAGKREGDGATPAGIWPMREVLFRRDRLADPGSQLPCRPIERSDGWCDAAEDPAYNRRVRLPYPASCETLWRADGLYDAIVVLGYNDAPVVAGAGSAIFLHIARPDFAPTSGCIALAREDLLAVLREAVTGALVRVEPG